jgi:hypothetical protein
MKLIVLCYEVDGSWFEVDCSWFEVDGSWFEVDCSWFEVDGYEVVCSEVVRKTRLKSLNL